MIRFFLITIVTSLFVYGASGKAFAHAGEDHGSAALPVSSTIAPRVEASSNDLTIVAVARGGKVTLYLDSFKGNEPVNDAVIEVDGPAGTVSATALGDGVYEIEAPWIDSPGSYDLAMTIIAGDILDVLAASLVIPDTIKVAATPKSGLFGFIPQALAADVRTRIASRDASLWVVGGGSFVAGLILALLFGRRRRAVSVPAAALAGAMLLLPSADVYAASPAGTPTNAAQSQAVRDISQRFADGSIFVPKPTQRILALRTVFTSVESYAGSVELPARIIPDPAATGYVQASISGRLVAPEGGFPRLGTKVKAGEVLAYVQPALGAADLASRTQDARELDQAIALEQRQLDRLRRISNVVSRSQIEDAEIELEGLLARRAGLNANTAAREPLVAPVSGVVAASQAIAGQIAEPNTIIYHIIDPERFWVEALSYQALPISGNANGVLADGRVLQLTYQGSGLADRNQAVPVQFGIEGQSTGLRIGQLLTVFAGIETKRQGVAVPRTSILRGANGQDIVFQHTNAERFVPREVRVEPLDGERVLIISGIEADQRVVTQGAELLNQIR